MKAETQTLCNNLIGVPFKWGGRSIEEGLDCYAVVRMLYAAEHGVLIPDYRRPEDATRIAAMMANQLVLWRPVETATPGSVILFRIEGHGTHVGFALNWGRFIHTWEKSGGVCVEEYRPWARRALGSYVFTGL